MRGTYWECQICHCSFSGHCSKYELKEHLDRDHGKSRAWLSASDDFDKLFKRRTCALHLYRIKKRA